MDKLKEIISEYTGVNPEDMDGNMSLSGNIGLDSFSLISIICDIEEYFKVDIPENEITNFQTLDDVYNYLSAQSK